MKMVKEKNIYKIILYVLGLILLLLYISNEFLGNSSSLILGGISLIAGVISCDDVILVRDKNKTEELSSYLNDMDKLDDNIKECANNVFETHKEKAEEINKSMQPVFDEINCLRNEKNEQIITYEMVDSICDRHNIDANTKRIIKILLSWREEDDIDVSAMFLLHTYYINKSQKNNIILFVLGILIILLYFGSAKMGLVNTDIISKWATIIGLVACIVTKLIIEIHVIKLRQIKEEFSQLLEKIDKE